MSHFFTVVLLHQGKKPLDVDGAVAKALAPFHEFECTTGTDDQYVKDIDKTEEVRKEYAESTATIYVGPNGEREDPFQDKFYREPTAEELEKHGGVGRLLGTGCGDGISWTSKDWGDGKGHRGKVSFVPEGWREEEVPRSEVTSFREFAEEWYGFKAVPFGKKPDLAEKHKYGYVTLDKRGRVVKVIDRTNPDARWDWYGVGGRWDRALLGARYRDTNNPHSGASATYGNVVPVLELPDDISAHAFVTPEGEWIENGKMGWWACKSGEKDEAAWKEEIKTILAKYKDCVAVGVDCHI